VHHAVHSDEPTLKLPPGWDYRTLPDAGRGVHGIVLEAFGAGNMPVTAVLAIACVMAHKAN
jgi:L-asparaginase/Glu-tRNA(Gln) amidotransferase subunit D